MLKRTGTDPKVGVEGCSKVADIERLSFLRSPGRTAGNVPAEISSQRKNVANFECSAGGEEDTEITLSAELCLPASEAPQTSSSCGINLFHTRKTMGEEGK